MSDPTPLAPTCPHCGNADLKRMTVIEYVEEAHPILRLDGSKIVYSPDHDVLDGLRRLRCDACDEYTEFDPPAGISFESD